MRHSFLSSRGRFLLTLSLALILTPTLVRADDWPQWLGAKRDNVWREDGILKKFPPGGPKILWRKPVGSGYGGPAVANDRVYVMDRIPPLGLDLKMMPENEGKKTFERILCLNVADGETLWKQEYECEYKGFGWPTGSRTTPLVDGDRVYTLGVTGVLCCLDAAKGDVIWKKALREEYKAPMPVWGFSASPLIVGNTLYTLVGGEGSAVVALDKRDGKELWRQLTSKEVCYSPPTLVEVDGKRHLIIWLGDSLNGLNPDNGKVLWSEPYPANGKPTRPAVNIIMPQQIGDLVFVSGVYHGVLVMKLKGETATVAWRTKANDTKMESGLRDLMSTPIVRDGYIYGPGTYGDLRCVKAADGQQLWESTAVFKGEKPLFSAVFMVDHGDRHFLFSDEGDLIIAQLTPEGYKEIDRTALIKPISADGRTGRIVVWCQPAFAHRCIFIRNDREILCVSLAADTKRK